MTTENPIRTHQVVNILRTGQEFSFDVPLAYGVENVSENGLQAEAVVFSHLMIAGYNSPSFTNMAEVGGQIAETLLHINDLQYVWGEVTCMTQEQFNQIPNVADLISVNFYNIKHDVIDKFYQHLYQGVKQNGLEALLSKEKILVLFDMNDSIGIIAHIIQKCLRAGKANISINDFLVCDYDRKMIMKECTAFDEEYAKNLTAEQLINLVANNEAEIHLDGQAVEFFTMHEARDLFKEYIENMGSRTLSPNDGLIVINGQKVAHFSLNLRLWKGAESQAENKVEFIF